MKKTWQHFLGHHVDGKNNTIYLKHTGTCLICSPSVSIIYAKENSRLNLSVEKKIAQDLL